MLIIEPKDEKETLHCILQDPTINGLMPVCEAVEHETTKRLQFT